MPYLVDFAHINCSTHVGLGEYTMSKWAYCRGGGAGSC